MPRPLWHYLKGISRTASDINSLRAAGISDISPSLYRLINMQNELIRSLGVKIPKPMTLLMSLIGLSPGEIKLWHDAEGGFFTQARSDPRLPWATHYVDDTTAVTLIKGELTHDLEEVLMTPDPYVGE